MTRTLEMPRATDDELAALARLVTLARSDTGQSRRAANFLLAWWNAERDGGFDFTDLWNVDTAVAYDMMTVCYLIARTRCYPDAFGFREDMEDLVLRWRSKRERSRRTRQ